MLGMGLILLMYAEEERQREERRIQRIERRRLRDANDPLQLPDKEFIEYFRLTKAGFQEVLAELGPYLPKNQRRTAVRNELKILAALRFYGSGSYHRNIGSSYLNLSQPALSRSFREVTYALNNREVLLKYIKFPTSRTQRENVMKDFKEKFGFPGIIGCIDGTHVALIRPGEHEELYWNKNSYHSLNVLIICDANLNILHVDASFGGAERESYIWNLCPINAHLEKVNKGNEQCWLLGDSDYPQCGWIMTPISDAASGSPEEFYNNLHCKVMKTVEQCIGALKARWQCLSEHSVMHNDPVTVGKVVNACTVLHNLAIQRNTPMPSRKVVNKVKRDKENVKPPISDEEDIIEMEDDTIEMEEIVPDNTRDELVQRIWNARTA